MITWGDNLLDTTQGLDILGVRGIDQAVEVALVNGITTISQRARYYSILPWALGEYLVDHVSHGFGWDSLRIYLRRVEFITLAATRLDSEKNGADPSGALGANLHQELLAKLLSGESVTFPDDTGGAMLGTYLGPCRAVGLLLDGDDNVPYRLSPRGRRVWELRKDRLRGSPVINAILAGNQISREIAESAVSDFSLGSLAISPEESRLLNEALVTPWDNSNEIEENQTARAYKAFNETIRWINDILAIREDNAADILVRNLKNCVKKENASPVAFRWAEYEYRRRCHFALELMLSALTEAVSTFEEVTTSQIVSNWLEHFEAPLLLKEIWPRASSASEMTASEAIDSIPNDVFENKPIPTRDLRLLLPRDRAFTAIAILTSTSMQTQPLRKDGFFDQKENSPGEIAVRIIEAAGKEPFSEIFEDLLNLTAFSHLQTTLRKMGAGQKCSLRFFPDGPLLRPTGIGMAPGYSNDRLTNVLRILTDLGELRRTNGKFAPIDRGAA